MGRGLRSKVEALKQLVQTLRVVELKQFERCPQERASGLRKHLEALNT